MGARASERWNVLLSGDITGAYEYLSPGYRSSVTSLQYQRSVLLNRIKWTGAKYISSECQKATCSVKIKIDYTLYGALPGVKSFDSTQNIEESWVLSAGEWYFVPSN